MNKWRFFRLPEFSCKCGCGKNNISHELVNLLDELRLLFGKPIVINSGCRCERHNKEVGGKPTSAHPAGEAVDIKCTTSRDRYRLLGLIFSLGFKRIGLAGTFIHVDISKTLPQSVFWGYKQ